MKEQKEHHIWAYEYDYISDHMMNALKEGRLCRTSDNPDAVISILNRDPHSQIEKAGDKNRENDPVALSQSMKKIVNRLMA
jgi:hypothetical protein